MHLLLAQNFCRGCILVPKFDGELENGIFQFRWVRKSQFCEDYANWFVFFSQKHIFFVTYFCASACFYSTTLRWIRIGIGIGIRIGILGTKKTHYHEATLKTRSFLLEVGDQKSHEKGACKNAKFGIWKLSKETTPCLLVSHFFWFFYGLGLRKSHFCVKRVHASLSVETMHIFTLLNQNKRKSSFCSIANLYTAKVTGWTP